ncbi:hypothetical protein PDL71_16580 [Lacibacter sp. MH-610]|uniref:hypothetical protein n=1 Tax=Lacibacter sp. MH-610 TaxID=3020883 RepID=UPI0038912A90
MTYTDKYIVETYAGLFAGLSDTSKRELIENLSKSLKTGKKTRDHKFFKSFGAFSSKKSAESIIADIKSSRKFTKKQIKL